MLNNTKYADTLLTPLSFNDPVLGPTCTGSSTLTDSNAIKYVSVLLHVLRY